jgi:hypothetical protein
MPFRGHLYLHFRDEGPRDVMRSLLGHRMDRPGDAIPPDDVFVLGVEYSDGRTGRSDHPNGDVLVALGGGYGGTGYFDARIWISPLPAEGPMLITCTWPARQLDAKVSLDGAAIIGASRSAVPLRDD